MQLNVAYIVHIKQYLKTLEIIIKHLVITIIMTMIIIIVRWSQLF